MVFAATAHIIQLYGKLPEFMDAHPELDVDIVLDDRVIDLVSEGIDIALRMGELADSAAVARKIATGRRSVVATPAYLDQNGIPQAPADIAAHQAVVYTQIGNSWTFRKEATEASVAVSGRVRFTAAEGIRAAVKADMGLAVTSDWMFWPELQTGVVVRILQDWTLPDIDLWAVFPTGRLASAKARAFADFVQTIVD
jgi:DNA-binding transcriptional LysR family regulator